MHTISRRRLVVAEIAALVLALDAVVALLLGAPAWVPIAFAVLAADAAAYAVWQARGLRRADAAPAGRGAPPAVAAG